MKGKTAFRFYQTLWVVADWVFPPACAGCGKPGFRFCPDCWSKTIILQEPLCPKCGTPLILGKSCRTCQSIKPAYDKLRSYAVFLDPLRQAIHNLKYKQDLALGMTLADPMIKWLKEDLKWQFDLIVTVPLNPFRQKERGYNQTNLIAYPIALALMIPFFPEAIKRVKNTIPQVGLSAIQRKANMEDAFIADCQIVNGKTVLLLDDVVTTGATINACTEALMKAGAGNVVCISVAKTPFMPSNTENINEMIT